MFEVMSITEDAGHECYRVSLRSSSKRVPNNPSHNGVKVLWLAVSRRQAIPLPPQLPGGGESGKPKP